MNSAAIQPIDLPANTLRREKRATTKLLLLCVGFIALIVGGVLLRFSSRSVLARNEIFPKFAAGDMEGRAVSWPSGPFILIYTAVDSPMGIQALKAIHLRQERGIAPPPVVSMINGRKEEILKLKQQLGHSFEVVQDNGLRGWQLGL